MNAVIYRTPNCPKCRLTERLLKIPYTVTMATQTDIDNFRMAGYQSFPVIQIYDGDQKVDEWCDFKPGLIKKWS